MVGAANGHVWKACIQCRRRSNERPTSAAFAEVVAKPLFAVCRHGPFCTRCAAAVQRCTLPACVCRALLNSWRQEEWPAAGPEDEPTAFTRPKQISDARRAEVADIVKARRLQPGGFQPTAALASAAADEEQLVAAPQAPPPQAHGSSDSPEVPERQQTAGFNRGVDEEKEELVKARAHQNGLPPAASAEQNFSKSSVPPEQSAVAAVFKRRGFQADGKEEKMGFRLKRNGEEKPAENSTLSAAQVAAAVAAEANHSRLLEDERDLARRAAKPSFQAQLPGPGTTSERRKAKDARSASEAVDACSEQLTKQMSWLCWL
eukprot:s64_g23.t1